MYRDSLCLKKTNSFHVGFFSLNGNRVYILVIFHYGGKCNYNVHKCIGRLTLFLKIRTFIIAEMN